MNISEFFKFLDTDSIQEESEACKKRSDEIEDHITLAHRVLERGRWFAESGVQHSKSAQTAINALHDRWARFAAAGHPAGELTIKDASGERSDDADCILQRATISVTALTELIAILHKGDAGLHKAMQDTKYDTAEAETAVRVATVTPPPPPSKPPSPIPEHGPDAEISRSFSDLGRADSDMGLVASFYKQDATRQVSASRNNSGTLTVVGNKGAQLEVR